MRSCHMLIYKIKKTRVKNGTDRETTQADEFPFYFLSSLYFRSGANCLRYSLHVL